MDIFKEGIHLYELAGYNIKINTSQNFGTIDSPDYTFSVWKDNQRVLGVSTTQHLQNIGAVIDNIKYLSFQSGVNKGQTKLQADFKKLLGV